ncbi:MULTISPECIES: signal peptidase II [Salimicrobium]|uniref:Lipoprotein signal peptidase n=2 Tax=Salimicrobium TaxID=351195 RepID=A0ABY1KPK0_9BACI|nr:MULTISPECIES: signal peptidase II [Salimicrobium]SDX33419.1 signal peptidase II [Salimicrobium album]SIS61848.1 signal peptidase II Aspartic peptidase. MEROPS family A08 [Salimicrobium salexigens]
MFRFYGLSLLIIAIDQISKWLVTKYMEIGERIPVIDSFLLLTSHRNQGAAWGILQGQMLFFYIITVLIVGFLIYYMQTQGKNSRWSAVAIALLLAGAIGNFIDRLFRKEVVDFVDVYIGSYNYPIFNVADASLTIGVILFLIATFIEDKRQKETEQP